MAVIINEFEAVAETPARRAASQDGEEREQTPPKIEPHDIARPLRVLMQQALRSWAH